MIALERFAGDFSRLSWIIAAGGWLSGRRTHALRRAGRRHRPHVEVEADVGNGMAGLHLIGMLDTALSEARDRVRSAVVNSRYPWPDARDHRQPVPRQPAQARKPVRPGHRRGPAGRRRIRAPPSGSPSRSSWASSASTARSGRCGACSPPCWRPPSTPVADRRGPRRQRRRGRSGPGRERVVPVAHLGQLWSGCAEQTTRPGTPPEAARRARAPAPLPSRTVRPGRRGRPARRPPRPGGLRRGRPQPLDAGPARHGQDHAGRAPAHPAAAPGARPGAGSHRHPLRRRGAAARTARCSTARRSWRPTTPRPSRPIIGGGSGVVRPGAVSLAHRGVLFLDEAPEFRRPCSTRSGSRWSRAGSRSPGRWARSPSPARFMLVLAANPCPCAQPSRHQSGRCRCTPTVRRRYLARLSGPLLDRIDVKVTVARSSRRELLGGPPVHRAERGGRRAGPAGPRASGRPLRRDPVAVQRGDPARGLHTGYRPSEAAMTPLTACLDTGS